MGLRILDTLAQPSDSGSPAEGCNGASRIMFQRFFYLSLKVFINLSQKNGTICAQPRNFHRERPRKNV